MKNSQIQKQRKSQTKKRRKSEWTWLSFFFIRRGSDRPDNCRKLSRRSKKDSKKFFVAGASLANVQREMTQNSHEIWGSARLNIEFFNLFRKKSNVSARVFQCSLLNGGIFLLSIILFDYVLLPVLETLIVIFLGQSPVWNLIQTTLSWIFSFIWVVPLFVLSKIINTFWFQDIADAAYEFRKGRPTLIPSISKLMADVVFSLIVQSLFLFQVSLFYDFKTTSAICRIQQKSEKNWSSYKKCDWIGRGGGLDI